MAALFISDCHLSAARPGPLEEFLGLMAGPARAMEAVYVLGDLFDLWLGDDDDAPGHDEVVAALGRTTAAGTPVYFMRGNHDFLAGDDFARRSGCRLLEDPTVATVAGREVLLLHGDTLCLDDVDYQAFRARMRSPEFTADFLARPLAQRRRLAGDIRDRSLAAVAAKAANTMDAAPRAVADAFRRHGTAFMIHGHTHRPAIHRHRVDGRTATRIVLDDWYDTGSGLLWEEAGFRPVAVSTLLNDDH